MMSEGGSSDQLIANAVDLLDRASMSGDWQPAFDAVVSAIGGSWGHICTLSPRYGATTGISSGAPADALKQFNAMKGGDPAVNPRAAAIYAAEPGKVMVENGAAGAGFHRDYYHRFDAHFACFARLDANEDETSVVKIFRSAAMGPPAERHRETFGRILPHIEQALAASAALTRRTVAEAALAWDEAAIAAYYCTRGLRVVAMSEHGARAAEGARVVSLNKGRLKLASSEKQRKLASCVSNAASRFGRERRTAFSASSSDGALFCRVTVAPAPESWLKLAPTPEVLVLLLNLGAPSNLDALRAAGLTEAEVDIARRLLESHTTREIAKARGAAIATVQTQIKAMHGKLGVTHRAELIKVLRNLVS